MSHSLLRSLVSNWLGLGLSILIGFLISPMVVHGLGSELYGYWALIVSITSQAILFDFGARNAIITYVARYRQRHEIDTLSDFLSSGLLFFGLCGLLAFIILLCLLPLFGSVFSVKPEYIFVVQIAFVVAVVDAASEVACGFYDGVLAASERYDLMNVYNIARLLLNFIFVWLVLHLGWGIIGVAAATLGSRLIQRLLAAHSAFSNNKGTVVSLTRIRKPILNQIASYGVSAAVAQFAYRTIYRADTIVAGIFIGATGVTAYAIPVILIDQFRMFAESGNYILTPRFSQLHANGDLTTTKTLLLKWSRLSLLLAVAIGCPLYITGADFINLWIGPEMEMCGPIIRLLTLPFFLTIPSMVFMYYLYATNRHGLSAKLLGLEAILNVMISVALVQKHGLNGIAFATLIPAIIFRGTLLPWFASNLGILEFPQYVRHTFLACLPLIIFQFTILILLQQIIGTHTWTGFVSVNTIAILAFFSLSYLFYLNSEDKAYIKRRLNQTIQSN